MRRHLPGALAALALAAAGAATAAAQDGRLGPSGDRLLAERRGERVCLTLVQPRAERRLRGCVLGAAPGRIRLTAVGDPCRTALRLVGIAPPGTVKVNLGDAGSGRRPAALRVLRIPTSLHRAGGTAFVVRRSVEGLAPRLTAYDAGGRRLAQREDERYPFLDCAPPALAGPDRG